MKRFQTCLPSFVKPLFFCLLAVALLAGCSSGGGSDPPPGEPTTSLQGAAFVPGGGAALKGSLYKALPGNGPFVGASVKATSLRNGIAYPREGVAIVGVDGGFDIADVPRGQDYLIMARKGNMVVMKLTKVPDNAPATMNIGEVDAASTSVALMLERFIKEALNLGDDFDLSRGTNGVDPEKLEQAVSSDDLVALEKQVLELATKVEELGDDVEALKDELAANKGTADSVAIVNVYNTVVQILTIANPNASDNTDDALHDWRDNGEIGGTTVACTQVRVEYDNGGRPIILVETNVVVTPVDLSDFLTTITKPQTTITQAPPNSTASTSASFEFESSRSGSTFDCQLDGGGFSGCTSPKPYDGLSSGQHTFCVVATDSDGVKDPSPACYTWTIFDDSDTTPPETTIIDGPQGPTGSRTATFAFSSNEAGSTFECVLDGDGSAFVGCTSPKTYTSLENGEHTFRVRATDPAGNTDQSPATRSWTVVVDDDPPETTITSGPPDPTDSTSAAFTFVSDEDGSTFQCKLDDGALVGCTSPAPYNGIPNGMHTFSVFATDPAGNPDPTPAVRTWTKVQDITPPETTIESGPLDPSSSTSATFTFSSNEDGSTFQCKLDGGGYSACVSPMTYTSLTEGDHTFYVFATDKDGNADPDPAAYPWTIAIPPLCAIFCEGFESGWGTWSADVGVWDVGAPTVGVGPGGCFGGTQCAGTVLSGNYPADTDSHLISPTIVLPTVAGAEEIHLRFRSWFSYSAGDSGQVQVLVRDPATGIFAAGVTEGVAVVDTSGWSLKDVDLTAYAGETVRLAFFHTAADVCCGGNVSTGWYIDDVLVVKKAPEFTGDFEAGWGDWSADRGVWQVGTPTAGPTSCFSGLQCAGTELAGNYGPNTDSRLVSPTIVLPTVAGAEEIHLRFRSWFSYSAGDSGQVQVLVRDPVTGAFAAGVNVGTAVVSTSGGWSLKDVDLTAYAGETVRLAFFHTAADVCCGGNVSTGWYIDNIQIQVF